MIMHIRPEILSKLSILNTSLNCSRIMNRRGITTNFPVNRGCLWPNDLVVTNYMLNVKSSTFETVKDEVAGGWVGL